MKNFIILSVFFLFRTSCLFYAQDNTSSKWSLRQCIEYALEHNTQIKRCQNTTEMFKVDIHTKKWARLPNLNGKVEQEWNWGRKQIATNDDENDNYNTEYVDIRTGITGIEITSEMPIFTGFALPNEYKLSKINFNISLADLGKAQESLTIQVTKAYLQVLFCHELDDMARQQIFLSDTLVKHVHELNLQGEASEIEVTELEAQLAKDKMIGVQTENRYHLALLELSQLLDLPTPDGFYLENPDTAIVFGTLTPPEDVYQTALLIKPRIQAAALRIQGSHKAIRIAQSGYYPQLSLELGLTTDYFSTLKRSFKEQMRDNAGKYISLTLEIPLFNRMEVRNRVRKARLEQIGYNLDLDLCKKELYKEIQQAWYNALAAKSHYYSSTAAVKANRCTFQLINQEFQEGGCSYYEHSEARVKLLQALSGQLQAKYEYLFRTKILNFYKGEPIY